jgi:hypothetical protein
VVSHNLNWTPRHQWQQLSSVTESQEQKNDVMSSRRFQAAK